MYSIVEVAGEQTKVTKGQVLRVPKLDVEPGKSVSFEKVMLIVDKDDVTVGNPLVANATVKATVVSHGKDKKVIIFKKKRRKTYTVLNGHRQEFTEIKIDTISVGKAKAEAKNETKDETKAEPEKAAKAAPVKKETKSASTAKKAAPKTAAAPKKTAAKKADSVSKTEKPKAAPKKKASAASKGEEE